MSADATTQEAPKVETTTSTLMSKVFHYCMVVISFVRGLGDKAAAKALSVASIESPLLHKALGIVVTLGGIYGFYLLITVVVYPLVMGYVYPAKPWYKLF